MTILIAKSRAEARALDLKFYQTGKACINGHRTWRYTSTGGCRSCVRDLCREWERNNMRYLGARSHALS